MSSYISLQHKYIYLSYIHLHLYTCNQYGDICKPLTILVFPNNEIAWTKQFIRGMKLELITEIITTQRTNLSVIYCNVYKFVSKYRQIYNLCKTLIDMAMGKNESHPHKAAYETNVIDTSLS